jgi:dTMP kinase
LPSEERVTEASTERGPDRAGTPLFVVLEGLDGAGTTTQVAELVRALRERGELVQPTREPTTGPFGAIVRGHLQGRELDERSVALAFAADRLEHVANEIEPLIRVGSSVVSDRYHLSSLAYQARFADYGWVKEINRYARRPDVTIFLDVPVEECVRRLASRPGLDRYERDPGELARFDALYRTAIVDLRSDGERIAEVSGIGSVSDVADSVLRAVDETRAAAAAT